jgi:hypothetical protein
MGSCRKDVEDLFRILQKEFRILRTPTMLFNKEGSIKSLLKTCCVLHKMLVD